MPTVAFRHPSLLFLLLAVPLATLLWLRACRLAGRSGVATPRANRANRVRGFLRLAALSFLILAASGPILPYAGSLKAAGVPLVFVLDVSASMRAADAVPDRLGAARMAILSILDTAPNARPALIAVADDAVVACPPTDDRQAFSMILEQIATDWMSAAGTNLRGGLERAEALIHGNGGAGAVVLVTDGEDHGPESMEAVRRMRGDGTPVHTVAVGTETGSELRGLPAGDPDTADAVWTRARPDYLARLATAGGGKAWTPTSLPQSPSAVLPQGTVAVYAKRTGGGLDPSPWLCGAAALLLAAAHLRVHRA